MLEQTKKILWVDDSPAHLVPSIAEVEKNANATIIPASTVSIALALLLQDNFDLIITDLLLPDKYVDVAGTIFDCSHRGGLVLIKLLQNGTLADKFAKPRVKDIPVIVYSAFGISELTSFGSGNVISIQKGPNSKSELIAAIIAATKKQ